LSLDPELGCYLTPERRAAVAPLLWTIIVDVPCGEWNVAPRRPGIGILVVGGLLAREVRVRDTTSAELLGAGDLIRSPADDGPAVLAAPVRSTVLQPVTAALLDASVARVFVRFPELMMAALDRVNARAQRLAVTQAISHITGVDRRLEALFWHLADRWGKVTPSGVVVPVRLSHRLLGSLVGARRPTVSTALAQLAEDGRVLPSGLEGWLLRGAAPRSSDFDALGAAPLPSAGVRPAPRPRARSAA
jgi:CRP/FNR family transcriptional regulator, cyclic AMP receptor protein